MSHRRIIHWLGGHRATRTMCGRLVRDGLGMTSCPEEATCRNCEQVRLAMERRAAWSAWRDRLTAGVS